VGKAGQTLSATDFAELTGVARERLRTWERRHGFPEPVRSHGGARRYAVDDVARVVAVRRAVEAGTPVTAAVAAAGPPPDDGVSAGTRSALAEHAPVAVVVLSGPEPLRVEWVNALVRHRPGAPAAGDELSSWRPGSPTTRAPPSCASCSRATGSPPPARTRTGRRACARRPVARLSAPPGGRPASARRAHRHRHRARAPHAPPSRRGRRGARAAARAGRRRGPRGGDARRGERPLPARVRRPRAVGRHRRPRPPARRGRRGHRAVHGRRAGPGSLRARPPRAGHGHRLALRRARRRHARRRGDVAARAHGRAFGAPRGLAVLALPMLAAGRASGRCCSSSTSARSSARPARACFGRSPRSSPSPSCASAWPATSSTRPRRRERQETNAAVPPPPVDDGPCG
jgi:hypothetical protein